MRKVLVMLTALIMSIMLCSCGSNDSSENNTTETTTETTTEKETVAKPTEEETTTESQEIETLAIEDYNTGITFDNLNRTPDDYKYKPVKFRGEVVQLIESSSENQIRLAIDGDYDKMILVGYDPSISNVRIIEDDWIEIYGRSVGIFQYESTMGATISIPAVYVDILNLIEDSTPSNDNEDVSGGSEQVDSGASVGELNALKKANSYLKSSAFSKEGLKSQLEFEGFTSEQINYAIENCGANWKEQALKKAKSYLKSSSFSKSGLLEQLEFAKFTKEEANYGVQNCGADWKEQAAKKAASYLKSSSFSREGLIEQLKFEGFTAEEAEYGVSTTGL